MQSVTVQLSGEINGGTTYRTVTPGNSCTQVAATGTTASGGVPPGVPTPPEETMVLGHPLNLVVVPSAYTGPGRYPSAAFTSSNAIIVDSHNWTPVQGTPAAQTAAVFSGDGSGSLMFTNWHDVADMGLESGTLTWTCRD